MLTRRWEKIRVQDILDNTGISRSAFYSHFEGKYDLLTAAIPELDVFVGEPESGVDLTPLFVHVEAVTAVMRPLLSQPVANEILDDIHRSFVRKWLIFLADTPHAGDDTLANLLAGAAVAAAKTYVMQRDRDDPRRVAAKVNAHLQRMVAA